MAKSVYDAKVVFAEGQSVTFEGVTGPNIVPSSPPLVIFNGPFGTTKGIVALGAGSVVRLENPQLLADQPDVVQ